MTPRLDRQARSGGWSTTPGCTHTLHLSDLAELLSRHPRHPAHQAPDCRSWRRRAGQTRSELEDEFLDFARRYGLPTPDDQHADRPARDRHSVSRGARDRRDRRLGVPLRSRQLRERPRPRRGSCSPPGYLDGPHHRGAAEGLAGPRGRPAARDPPSPPARRLKFLRFSQTRLKECRPRARRQRSARPTGGAHVASQSQAKPRDRVGGPGRGRVCRWRVRRHAEFRSEHAPGVPERRGQAAPRHATAS